MDDTLDLDIEKIRQTCADGRIKWTAHTLERMQERGIEPTDVINCVKNGKIIEQYPQAYPYPACLILGKKTDNTYIHVVLGYGMDFIWIVTAYEPDEDEWQSDLSERRKS